MDHHTLAAVSITGTCLDVIGSLYLAYDLLGGQQSGGHFSLMRDVAVLASKEEQRFPALNLRVFNLTNNDGVIPG